MSIKIIDELAIKGDGDNTKRVVADGHRVRGYYGPAADHTERNAIIEDVRRQGMRIVTLNDSLEWSLKAGPWAYDDTDWALVSLNLDQVLPVYGCTLMYGGSAILELGATLSNPSFTASYVRTPAAAVLTMAAYTLNVIGGPTSFQALTEPVYTAITTLPAVLTASETGGPSKTAQVDFSWYPMCFYGKGAAGQSSAEFIQALEGSFLANARAKVFTVTPGLTDKIYFAYPVSFGLATFYAGGFEGGFTGPVTTNSVTNSHGVALSYYVYESSLTNLGQTTITVQ